MMEALQLLLPAVLSMLAWHKGSRVACLPPFPAAPAPASAVHPPSSRPSVSPRPPSPCALINSYLPSNPGGGAASQLAPCSPAHPVPCCKPAPPCGLSPPPLGRGSCAVSLPHSLHLCVSPTVRPPDQDPPGLGFRGAEGACTQVLQPPPTWGSASAVEQGHLQAVPSAAPTLPPPRAGLFLGGQCPSH